MRRAMIRSIGQTQADGFTVLRLWAESMNGQSRKAEMNLIVLPI